MLDEDDNAKESLEKLIECFHHHHVMPERQNERSAHFGSSGLCFDALSGGGFYPNLI